VARSCGFSKSMLSKIERGRVVPSVGTLIKIAGSLGTTIAALMQADGGVSVVHTRRERSLQDLVSTGKGVEVYGFATEHRDNRMQPFLCVAHKGKVKKHNDSHGGQEFIFVLCGVLKVRVGDVEYRLREGDSVYFDSMDDHECTPDTDDVRYLDIFA
jgi:quercetin dioxygenase-like cupin family protein